MKISIFLNISVIDPRTSLDYFRKVLAAKKCFSVPTMSKSDLRVIRKISPKAKKGHGLRIRLGFFEFQTMSFFAFGEIFLMTLRLLLDMVGTEKTFFSSKNLPKMI